MADRSGVTRWEELSGPRVGTLLAAEAELVGLLPVGATEQHGPHLPTGTDTIIASALCDAISLSGDSIVLPALPIGASWWHGTQLAGTLAVSGEEIAQLAVAAARWATHSGLRRLLFVNGHVGNTAPLTVACDRLRLEYPRLRIGVVQWWSLSDEIAAEVVSDAVDWHANRAETSLMLAIRPDLVDQGAAKGADDRDRSTGLVFRYPAAATTINGVTGSPSAANAHFGIQLWDRVVSEGRHLVARARSERAPLA